MENDKIAINLASLSMYFKSIVFPVKKIDDNSSYT